MVMRTDVDRWMGEAYAEPWAEYFEAKRDRGDLVRVRDVFVDIPNVIERPFTCDPTTCSPGLRKRGKESCCKEFSVEVTQREIKTLGKHFDGVSAFLSARDPHWAKQVKELDDVVGDHPDNRYQRALGKRQGRCAWSFLDERGAILCGIHGYALENELDVFAIKPKLCFLFPLLVQDLADGTWMLTVLDDENSELVSFTSMEELPCLAGADTFGTIEEGAVPFYIDHRTVLSHLFGKAFVNGLDRLARDRGMSVPGAELVPLQRKRRAS